MLAMAHLLIVATLFFAVLIGIDPLPHRPSHPVRVLVLLLVAVAHAVFGVALMQQDVSLAPTWWVDNARPWGPTAVQDTVNAGAIAWTFGELPMLSVILLLVRQWSRADERQQRRRDRAADRPGILEAQHLEQYNRMLADLSRAQPATRLHPPGADHQLRRVVHRGAGTDDAVQDDPAAGDHG